MHSTAIKAGKRGSARARFAGLAVGVVALSGALLSAAQAQPMTGGPGAGGPRHAMAQHRGPGHEGPMMLSDRVLDSVGANADQKARVRDIMGRARADLHTQRENDRALHQQMMGILAAPQVDAAAAESLRQQLAGRHDQASKRQLQALLDASAVLTPEQRQKLSERAKSHREMHERHRRERDSLTPRS